MVEYVRQWVQEFVVREGFRELNGVLVGKHGLSLK